MASCAAAHKEFDHQVGRKVAIGTLPAWTRVTGKVAYIVLRGPYDQLPEAWGHFPQEAMRASQGASEGPSGDVYLCNPMDHPDDPSKLLTLLYLPVR